MRLTAKVKLETSDGSFAALDDTLREANRCCNWLSEQAWTTKVFAQFKLHRLAYKTARAEFPKLNAQCIVRCIAKVSQSYAIDTETKRVFRLNGAIAYDLRLLTWYIEKDLVSIWTTSGRLKIRYAAGTKQKELLKFQQGETDLILHRQAFYLASACNIDNPEPGQVEDFLGCDFGINNILTDSDGRRYSGATVKSVRHRHKRLRKRLQQKGTKSCKRRLKKLSGKESRFSKDTNHRISKEIVAIAKDTKRGIALEDLTYIQSRTTVGRAMRGVLHSWAFAQLRGMIEYKAKREGVPVVIVDPRNTSRECFRCGHTSKKNRPNQRTFQCRQCGFQSHADKNAAWNIRSRGRAVINQPNVAIRDSITHGSAISPPASLVGN